MTVATNPRLLSSLLCLTALACSAKEGSESKRSEASAPALVPAKAEAKPAKKRDKCKFKGRVEKDVTLYKACSPYMIKGGIDVLENVTMTIEAGVEMRFRDGDWFEISAASKQGGRLVAKGTPEEPIVLTSVEPETTATGTWLGLWFAEGTRDSVLEHVVIRAAGGNNTFLKPPLVHGCLTFTGVKPGAVSVNDVHVEGCVNAGIVLLKSQPTLGAISMRNLEKGFLLDGTDPQLVPKDTQYEQVKVRVAKGRSLL